MKIQIIREVEIDIQEVVEYVKQNIEEYDIETLVMDYIDQKFDSNINDRSIVELTKKVAAALGI